MSMPYWRSRACSIQAARRRLTTVLPEYWPEESPAKRAASRCPKKPVCMRREIVYLIGPSLNTNGGIGYAVATYFKSSLVRQYRLIHISTHREGNRLTKAWAFAKGVTRFLFLKLTRGGRLVHLHSGYGPSFVRKTAFFLISKHMGCRVVFQFHGGDFEK